MKTYSSPYSSFQLESEGPLLTMIWAKDSSRLDETGVIAEISAMAEYIKEHQVRYVIVDSRNYHFRDNQFIQTWITRIYIPILVDSFVKKYAIVVGSEIIDQLPRSEISDEEVLPMVEYFTDLEEAQKWIKSKSKNQYYE